MRTKMTEMCGIKYPIMNAGMAYVATPELVAAVSNAGGLGLLATSNLTPDKTRESIKKIRQLTDKTFGANVTLQFEFAEANAKVLLEEKVPIINWSLGTAGWIIKAAHEYGGKVFGTVTIAKHALRAEKDGADGLIVTGHEAAGHGGEVTSLVLIDVIARKVKIPIIAAGGFCDGSGLAAALVLGAEGISMGTAFALVKESPVHQMTKDTLFKATELDTFYTDKIDGLSSRMFKTELVLSMAKGRLSPAKLFRSIRKVRRMLGLSWPRLIAIGLQNGNVLQQARHAHLATSVEMALTEGNISKGLVTIGQIVGMIDKEVTCQQLIDMIMKEASEVLVAKANSIQRS